MQYSSLRKANEFLFKMRRFVFIIPLHFISNGKIFRYVGYARKNLKHLMCVICLFIS